MKATSLLATLALLAATPLAAAATRGKPNIIVILVDDMGFSDFACYGSEIPTPNIDKLAAGGLRFSQFHNTGRCSPTRASLLTGLYPHQAGMGHLDGTVKPGSLGFQGRLRDSCVTMAEALAPAGYFTAMTGKWHLGQQHGTPPWERGFRRSLNLQAGGVHFSDQTGSKGNAKLFLDGRPLPKDDPRFEPPWYGTDLWTDWGIRFLDEARDAGQPLFLYLAHCAPHFPLMAPEETIAKYRGKYLAGWDTLRAERHRRQLGLGLVRPEWKPSARPDSIPAWDELDDASRRRFDDMMAIYAAMIDEIDQSIGRLVAALRERGELDHTLILLLSDNGGNAESGPQGRYRGQHPGDGASDVFLGESWAFLNNTPFRKYKHYVHEGGTATPLIAHWPAGMRRAEAGDDFDPGARGGPVCHRPGHLVDLMPTVLEAAGAGYPREFKGHAITPMEGVSLLPLLKGQAVARRQPIFFEHEANRAVRDGRWKLVALAGQAWELYDLEADRTELHDLAKKHPDRVQALADAWEQWAKRADCDAWQPKKAKNASGNRKKNNR